ncbi:GEM-like protein 4 [Punica granatum]|uniref:GEM-like protein 4 n=1 Tax=Punica granatum TaxID=22663 RepID=A0A6P8CDH1_PUNGR|nr:GEM-like protein 4 [Punica granatum]
MKMRKQFMEQVIGVPVISGSLLLTDSDSMQCRSSKRGDQLQKLGKGSMLKRMNKLGKKADVFAHSFRDHVRSSPKISETVKGKLSLGVRFLLVGGREKVFKTLFNVSDKETLLKASHCCLSTTAGPIAGLLFISTRNIAFFSHRSLKLSCPNGDTVKVHYKVLIPLSKIERANQSKNVKKPSQKYIQIVTVDNFDFWFMGFLNFQKTWKYLQQALFLEHRCDK